MVLCVLDDLIFSVRISTAAKTLQVPVYFERQADRVVVTARERRPTRIIIDLNSVRMKPFDVIASLKADPELADIPVVGFVSHQDVDAITRARAAGVTEVMARSAFVERLPALLTPA